MNTEQSKYKNIAHTFHVKYANVHIKDITIAQLFDKIFYALQCHISNSYSFTARCQCLQSTWKQSPVTSFYSLMQYEILFELHQ